MSSFSEQRLRNWASAIWDDYRDSGLISTSNLIEISRDPSVLLVYPRYASDILLVNLATAMNAAPVMKQLHGIITPELLCQQIRDYAYGEETSPTVVEVLTRENVAHHIDPTVYRKAMATALRKEESQRRNVVVEQIAHEIYTVVRSTGRLHISHVEFINSNPSALLVPVGGTKIPLLVYLAWNGVSSGIRDIARVVTPELLLTKVEHPFNMRKITLVELLTEFGCTSPNLIDPTVYRKAIGQALRKEESGAKGIISQLTR